MNLRARELQTLSWPASRFLWATAPSVACSPEGVPTDAARAELAPLFPAALDGLHLVVVNPRACPALIAGVRTSDLETLGPEVGALVPDSPDFAKALGIGGRANMLVGAWRPSAQLRRERAGVMLSRTGITLSALMLCVGLHRRAGAERDRARTHRADSAMLLADNNAPFENREQLDDELSLQRDLRTARASLGSHSGVAPVLAALLRDWPAERDALVQSLSLGEGRVDAAVFHTGDAPAWLRTLRAPTGWTLAEPRMVAAQGGVRLQLAFTPASKDHGR